MKRCPRFCCSPCVLSPVNRKVGHSIMIWRGRKFRRNISPHSLTRRSSGRVSPTGAILRLFENSPFRSRTTEPPPGPTNFKPDEGSVLCPPEVLIVLMTSLDCPQVASCIPRTKQNPNQETIRRLIRNPRLFPALGPGTVRLAWNRCWCAAVLLFSETNRLGFGAAFE
jgi:hypothetical protein